MMATIDMERGGRSQLLLGEWSAELTARSGLKLKVRPAAPADEARLADFFANVSPDDIRFRFLSPLRKVGHGLLQDLVRVDHTGTENFLAFDASGRKLIATAMLAAEPSLERAEVAIATRADMKHKGIGWTLLRYLTDYAEERGIKSIESIECRDNREAISLEREMGFTATTCPGDATLVLVSKALGTGEK
jgi:acetyltransferase